QRQARLDPRAWFAGGSRRLRLRSTPGTQAYVCTTNPRVTEPMDRSVCSPTDQRERWVSDGRSIQQVVRRHRGQACGAVRMANRRRRWPLAAVGLRANRPIRLVMTRGFVMQVNARVAGVETWLRSRRGSPPGR